MVNEPTPPKACVAQWLELRRIFRVPLWRNWRDAIGLGPVVERRAGSNPAGGTRFLVARVVGTGYTRLIQNQMPKGVRVRVPPRVPRFCLESIAGKVWSPPAKRMNRAKPTIGFRLSCSPPIFTCPVSSVGKSGNLVNSRSRTPHPHGAPVQFQWKVGRVA